MGGGGSSSSSSSATSNIDKRLVTGQNSVGVSADNSTVTVQVLDGGAIAGALELARQTDANSGKNLGTVLGFASGLYESAMKALENSAAMVRDSSATNTAMVATAYDQAKGQGADARVLAYGAMAVVALVAVKSFGK